MKPADVIADYRAVLAEVGETVTVSRTNPPPLAPTDVQALARVTGYTLDELQPGVEQGRRKVVLLAEDVTFDPPLRAGDKVTVRGTVLNIDSVDDNTRRVGGTLIAYELQASGG